MPRPAALALFERALGKKVQLRFVEPVTPGLELTQLMQRQLADGPAASPEGVTLWVLAHHGLVWAADDDARALAACAGLERFFKRELGLSRYPRPHAPGARGCRAVSRPASGGAVELCFCAWPRCTLDLRPLFPDFVVYFRLQSPGSLTKTGPRRLRLRAKDARDARDKSEVLYAHALVGTLARERGCFKALPAALARTIEGLETEKARLRQAARA